MNVVEEGAVVAVYDAIPHVQTCLGAALRAFFGPAASVAFVAENEAQTAPVVHAVVPGDVIILGGEEVVAAPDTVPLVVSRFHWGPGNVIFDVLVSLDGNAEGIFRVHVVSGFAGAAGALAAVTGFLLGHKLSSVDVKFRLLVDQPEVLVDEYPTGQGHVMRVSVHQQLC